ncbi:glycosyltransferase family 2 protein [Mucilaginibacter agri]|uniref:Glycosyltransferase n=1 Tax=Mucilaginibacter agri TaxID=2695265 RepID=A0A965ZFZ2_9SPHI|nr:glycosyltransferase [Mucilaginibacter agri]NCD69046.1 glycosyltransferase [Mucilaginibacter agri]
MSDIPQISVLMPAYNAGLYIAEAIRSVLEQTFTDFELLIINDGSTDNTIEVVNSFADNRIRLVNQKNEGVAGALNTGLRLSKAQFIARFDADDICYPTRLEVQHDFMQARPQYHIIGSDTDYVDKEGNHIFHFKAPVIPKQGVDQLSYQTCPFIHSSVFYRKASILEQGGYNIYAHTFEDHLLWLKVLKQYPGYNLPQRLIKVRLNPESVTIDEKWCHPRFLEIKSDALRKGDIGPEAYRELVSIRSEQLNNNINHEAYYGLLAKKFLWNNHNPQKARYNLFKLLAINKLHFKSYLLLLLTLLPAGVVHRLYHTTKGGATYEY